MMLIFGGRLYPLSCGIYLTRRLLEEKLKVLCEIAWRILFRKLVLFEKTCPELNLLDQAVQDCAHT